jgi:hypothetical protein
VIAKTLGMLADRIGSPLSAPFSADSVSACSSATTKRGAGRPLESLFQNRTDRDFDKQLFVRLLIDQLIEEATYGDWDDLRDKYPVIGMLTSVIKLAQQNHPAIRRDTWLETQQRGHFGTTSLPPSP